MGNRIAEKAESLGYPYCIGKPKCIEIPGRSTALHNRFAKSRDGKGECIYIMWYPDPKQPRRRQVLANVKWSIHYDCDERLYSDEIQREKDELLNG